MLNCRIKHYCELSVEELFRVYAAGRHDGALPMVLYDVDADLTYDQFSAFAHDVPVFGAGFDGVGRVLGFFYLTDFVGDTAHLHFCTYALARARRHELGRMVMAWCFKSFELKSLIGVVPALYAGACKYALEMGGKKLGLIPGLCWLERFKRSVSGVVFIFTAEKQ